MAEQERADAPDRFAHGTGRAGAPGVAGAGPQSIEATTAALGDMEPSAGAGGGASRAETDNDTDNDDTGRG
jgi:hypothetical protein